MTSMSLRSRLFMLILPPLLLLSIVLGFWRFEVAQRTSETLFDRSLLAAALAISRDVAISGGDALSPSTRDFVSDAGAVSFSTMLPVLVAFTSPAMPIRPFPAAERARIG